MHYHHDTSFGISLHVRHHRHFFLGFMEGGGQDAGEGRLDTTRIQQGEVGRGADGDGGWVGREGEEVC